MTEKSIREWCIEKGYIDENYHQKHFATFDVETLAEEKNQIVTDKTYLHCSQRVVTVSVSRSWGPDEYRSMVFKRRTFSQDEYELFINNFLSHLHELQSLMVDLMPRKILESIAYLSEESDAIQRKERNYSPEQANWIRRGLHYLKKLQMLKIYGYNSASYDLPVLFQGK